MVTARPSLCGLGYDWLVNSLSTPCSKFVKLSYRQLGNWEKHKINVTEKKVVAKLSLT